MARRNLQFYSELVLVTVLSLIAANAWVRWITQTLNYFFPGSLRVDFITAVITTILAVWILHMVFSEEKSEEQKSEEEGLTDLQHRLYSADE